MRKEVLIICSNHDNDHDLHKLGSVSYLAVSIAEKAHKYISVISAKRSLNKYTSVDKSRIRIIGTISWTRMDFAIQSLRFK